jgi:hypothetical protein
MSLATRPFALAKTKQTIPHRSRLLWFLPRTLTITRTFRAVARSSRNHNNHNTTINSRSRRTPNSSSSSSNRSSSCRTGTSTSGWSTRLEAAHLVHTNGCLLLLLLLIDLSFLLLLSRFLASIHCKLVIAPCFSQTHYFPYSLAGHQYWGNSAITNTQLW